MISSESYRKVSIHITTYRNKDLNRKTIKKAMDRPRTCLNESNKRFICSLCLTSNTTQSTEICGNRHAKPCPICYKKHPCDHSYEKSNKESILKYPHTFNTSSNNKRNEDANVRCKKDHKDYNTKTVQTSQTDLTQDLSLLKEVLTVFQTKKQIDIQNNSKTIIMKDVSIGTDTKSNIELKPKLTKSRIFQFSIEDDHRNNGHSFKIINYSQPNNVKASQYSIDLIKHKSSSIPQMKMEELKYSLKEKTISKDAIEEVNRMFATVRRNDNTMPNLEQQNRPMIRNGPRVLPVVKTKNNNCFKDELDRKELPDGSKISFENNRKSSDCVMASKIREKLSCKCCQTNNIQLSGGDSFLKHDCCHHKMLCEGKCEKCVYMLCCHYQEHTKMETSAFVCEYCNNSEEIPKERCEGGNHCGQF